MSLRYTGPKGDYPVYCCRADRDHKAGPLCQEVRALAIDAFVERTFLDALAPDQIAIAVAALGQLQQEARGWRSNGHCGASAPATRPSGPGANTTRSSPRTGWWRARWSAPGKRSCAVEEVEQEYERWRRAEPLS